MARSKRWMVVSDSHGNECDPDAVKTALKFADDFEPHIRVHAGDVFDAACLRKNASAEEKERSIVADVDAGCTFLGNYRPTHVLWGNHDRRIFNTMETGSGPTRDLCVKLVDQIRETLTTSVQRYDYDKRTGVMPLGDWLVIHGYGSGMNAVREAAMVYGRVMMGHTHHIEEVPTKRHDGASGRCIGCLCRLDLEYNFSQLTTLRQANGFAFGVIDGKGQTIVRQARRLPDGTWDLPEI